MKGRSKMTHYIPNKINGIHRVKYYTYYIKYVIFRYKTAKDPRVIYSIRNENRNIYHTHTQEVANNETIQTQMDPGQAKVSV